MSMTPGSPDSPRLLHLRAVAREVGNAFARDSAVAAILVFGSVANGAVDAFSDADLLIVCRSAVPALADREAVLTALGSGWRYGRPQEGSLFRVVDADGRVAGVLVSVHYQTVAWIDAVLDAVLEHGAITTAQMPFRPYTVPALLQRAWVLLDRDGDVARWREASVPYPPLLRANILRHVVPALREYVDELTRTAERNLGAREFIFFLNAAVDELTSLLFALNGVYDPAERRMQTTVVPSLPDLPPGYVATITEVLEGPFDRDGARRSARLFEQVARDAVRQARGVLGADADP
ncbi:MAG: hypothetical protein QOF73_660 [Thermomicrobiales bacterium]|jgi:predicted nucleotidyltransferase|nr:hypothetical protein [Thermomicrobiales bacterium]